MHHGVTIPQEVKRFAAVAWEVLNILREHFPSKFHLYQEGLEDCGPEYRPLSAAQELRRELSCISSRKEEKESPFLRDEVEDLLFTFASGE